MRFGSSGVGCALPAPLARRDFAGGVGLVVMRDGAPRLGVVGWAARARSRRRRHHRGAIPNRSASHAHVLACRSHSRGSCGGVHIVAVRDAALSAKWKIKREGNREITPRGAFFVLAAVRTDTKEPKSLANRHSISIGALFPCPNPKRFYSTQPAPGLSVTHLRRRPWPFRKLSGCLLRP